MTKKTPPKPAVAQSPQELDAVMEMLAMLTGRLQGLEGAAITKHITDLKGQVQSLVRTIEVRADDDEARKQAAAEVERLVDSVVKTGSATGKAIEAQREPLTDAFKGIDLSKMAEGLRLLAEWLANPTDEGRARVEDLVGNLQRTMGTVIGYDPAREDAARQAEIKKGVQASLDQIFRPKKPA